MTDLKDIDFLDHLAGKGSAEKRQQFDQQIKSSPPLKQRCEQLSSTWKLLGQADRPCTGPDLWEPIDDRVRSIESSPHGFGYASRASWWFKADAVLVIESGLA